MNQRLLFLLLGFFLLANCSKKDMTPQYEATGLIVGQDLTLCPCCGGCILQIDGDANVYRTDSLPTASFINCQDSTAVKFNWTFNRSCGGLDYITIDGIALQ